MPTLGKVAKYAATRATADRPTKRLVSGSRSSRADAVIANTGLSCCSSITTEKGMYWIRPSAAV